MLVSKLCFCKAPEAVLLKQLDLNWLTKTNPESAALYFCFHLFWKFLYLLSKVVTVCGFAGNAAQSANFADCGAFTSFQVC